MSWLPALDGWMVTRRDLAMEVMRDATAFTVDDPRFSTAQVVGPSMLSLDGDAHRHHRDPFARPFRLREVRERFTALVADETDRLIDAIAADGEAELRRALAGPLAAAVVTFAIGAEEAGVGEVLRWYDGIVASVTQITAGGPPTEVGAAGLRRAAGGDRDGGRARSGHLAAGRRGRRRRRARPRRGGFERRRAAVRGDRDDGGHDRQRAPASPVGPRGARGGARRRVAAARRREESLRLEPAATVVDRYATRDLELGGARIGERQLVIVSIAAANRDPAVFTDPDRFDLRRENAKLHLAFAHGPHVCIGMHLARLEAYTAVSRVLERLPGLRLDPAGDPAPRGLVFRKPAELRVRWSTGGLRTAG